MGCVTVIVIAWALMSALPWWAWILLIMIIAASGRAR